MDYMLLLTTGLVVTGYECRRCICDLPVRCIPARLTGLLFGWAIRLELVVWYFV